MGLLPYSSPGSKISILLTVSLQFTFLPMVELSKNIQSGYFQSQLHFNTPAFVKMKPNTCLPSLDEVSVCVK